MHVIIAGCGRVGSELALSIRRAGHSIALIDKNPKAFERLQDDPEQKRVVGFAFDRDVLEEAGIADASALAAVTSGDNSNIVAARVAREHYRVAQVIARIYDPRRAQIYQRLGIQTVATVRWTTDQMLRHLIPDDVGVEHTIDNGEVVVTALSAPAEVIGKSGATLDVDGLRRIVAVSRFGVPRIPNSTLTIQEGDVLHVAVPRREASFLLEELKKPGGPQ
ncbi:MAG: TrkA family potassium uptake protein [Actinobacteria bacterium]|nr:TrkA family potassium uptake protein [Actinomycetota bacterium]